MESLVPSTTPTLAGNEDHDHPSHPPLNRRVSIVSKPHPGPHHDPNSPDLSFPFATTNVQEGGMTDEYRLVSSTGLISADTALRPIPSHVSQPPNALRDPEKAKHLKDIKLVTWLENDPEDPRNYSNAYKWCKFVSSLISTTSLTRPNY